MLSLSAHLPGLVWSAELDESLSAVFVFLAQCFVGLNVKVYQYRSVHWSRLSRMVDYSHM